MQILLTGGTGFIGTALVPALLAEGHSLLILSRDSHEDRPDCRYLGNLDQIDTTECIDAVINLAGASLAERRWSTSYKAEIVASRLDTTTALLRLFERLERRPAVLLSASAIGYYGHSQQDSFNEDSNPQGEGFAQSLCRDWEALAEQAICEETRVCLLRLGVVLDGAGGALLEMARSFQFGVGSWIGTGQQWLSWVHRADVVAAILLLLARDDLAGPFNLTAPAPISSRQLCIALGKHHRTLFSAPVPAPVMRLMVGEMAQELLLQGQRVLPRALQAAGFEFRYPDIDGALDAIYS